MNTKTKKLKLYAVILGIVYLAGQHAVYLFGHDIANLVGITPILPKIALDDSIKVVSVFIIPYIWSYIFWAMGPMAVSKCSTSHFLDYLVASLMSLSVGLLILIFVPTYMDRVAEGLFNLECNTVFDKIRQFWYSLDGSEMAYNLFPSFHCINSTMCYLGVMGRKEIPKWFRVYSLVTALLIFASTVFVKQHYILDVVSGVIIAAVCFAISKKYHLGNILRPLVNKYIQKKHINKAD